MTKLNTKYPLAQFIFFLIIVMTFLQSCDPSYKVEWKVINNTDQNITIYSKTWQDNTEKYNSLSPNTTLLLMEEYNIGIVKSQFKYTEETPFYYLLILNSNSDTLKTDVHLTKNWNEKNINNEIAEYTLVVSKDEF